MSLKTHNLQQWGNNSYKKIEVIVLVLRYEIMCEDWWEVRVVIAKASDTIVYHCLMISE